MLPILLHRDDSQTLRVCNRECLVCYSLKIAMIYYNLQRVAVREGRLSEKSVIQLFYNAVNVEDGFDSRFCMQPHGKANRFVGLHGPILETQGAFVPLKEPGTGRMMLDVSAAVWTPPRPQAVLQGQSVASRRF